LPPEWCNLPDVKTDHPRRAFWLAAACGVAALLALAACKEDAAKTSESDKTADAAVAEAPPALDSAMGGYLAGRYAQQQHDYGDAAAFMERSLQGDPDNFDLVRRVFTLRLSEGRIDDAADLAKRIASHDGATGLAALVLLEQAIKRGDFDGAAKQAAAIPRDGAQRFAVPLLAAWVDAGRGQTDKVGKELAAMGNARGLGPLKLLHETLIADVTDQTAKADAGYRKLVAVETPPTLRVAQLAGNFYERHGEADAARALYQSVAASDDSDVAASGLARLGQGAKPDRVVASPADGAAEAMFDLASLLNERETLDAGLVYARLALDLKPDFTLAQLLAGEMREAQDREAAALELYRAVDAKSPFAWTARLRAALALDALSRTDEARATLEAMATERPDRSEALIELGDIERSHSRFTEAASAYSRGLDRIHDANPRNWRIYYSRGVAYERAGDWPRAEADLKHALELQPDQPLVLNYLGYTWIDKGENIDQAMKMIQRAVELRPTDGYIVDSLGWAYYRLGDYARATQTLERAIELVPEDPTINDHLGDAYWRNERLGEARFQWRRALQFKPEADEVKKIEAKLDRGLPDSVSGG
jgi:tetratricopeptide (TPR) repeat protein